MNITSWIMPSAVVFIVLYGLIKKVRVFDCFVEGAKQGIATISSLLPPLTGLVVAVSMLRFSGGIDLLEDILAPVSSLLGIPKDVIPLCILSPVSGSGSLTVFENILKSCGPDSTAGRIASVISGATETTFYAVTVYFGAVGIKKTGTVIPCAVLGDLVSFVAATLTVKYLL